MKSNLLSLVLVFVSIINVKSQEIKFHNLHPFPTEKLIENVFIIQTDTMIGTGFFIQEKEKVYIITARHLFKKHHPSSSKVSYIIDNGKFTKLNYSKIYFKKDIDIAVIETDLKSIDYPIKLDFDFYLGHKCAFLGYPKDFYTPIQGFKRPIYKDCTVAGVFEDNILLNAMNISGFSGGPVFLSGPDGENYIMGVICGYFGDKEYINTIKSINKDTKEIKMDSLGISKNLGLAYAFSSKHIIEIIKTIP